MAAAAESHCRSCWVAVAGMLEGCLNCLLPPVPADLGVARFVGADMRSAAGFCPTHAGAGAAGQGCGGLTHGCALSKLRWVSSMHTQPDRFTHFSCCFRCWTAAPEQILGHRCTLAADMYSFGLLLIQLATQQAVVQHRGDWRMPCAPDECPQVGSCFAWPARWLRLLCRLRRAWLLRLLLLLRLRLLLLLARLLLGRSCRRRSCLLLLLLH